VTKRPAGASPRREAGKAALTADELARRFGLTSEVPCVGTDLQGLCKLLGDARGAGADPSGKGQITRLAREKAQAQRELAAARQKRAALAGRHRRRWPGPSADARWPVNGHRATVCRWPGATR